MDTANLPHTVHAFSPSHEILRKNHTLDPSQVPDLLTITRTTYKTRFIKHGEDVYLLVYLNEFSDCPFIRVPVSELYRSCRDFMRGMHA